MAKLNINLKEKIESLAGKAADIAETGYNLALINVAEKVATASSVTILLWVVLLLINFLFLFIGVGAALWIGYAINNMTAGFFIVAGVYFLIILLLLLLGKSVIIPFFRNTIIKKMYE